MCPRALLFTAAYTVKLAEYGACEQRVCAPLFRCTYIMAVGARAKMRPARAAPTPVSSQKHSVYTVYTVHTHTGRPFVTLLTLTAYGASGLKGYLVDLSP